MSKPNNVIRISDRKRHYEYIDAEEIFSGISEEDRRMLQEEAFRLAVTDGMPEDIARELYLSGL